MVILSKCSKRKMPLYVETRKSRHARTYLGWVIAFVVTLTALLNGKAVAQSYAFGVGSFAVPQYPRGVVTADFNGDGRLDIAVVNFSSSISILMGQPDGSFAPHVDYLGTQADAVGLIAADINGDGKIDLITLVSGPQTPCQIFFGNGDGTFRSPINIKMPGVVIPSGFAVGDFNKDGKLDLVVMGMLAAYQSGVAVVLGNGDGTFGPETDYPTAPGSNSVIVADFNGDSTPDLAVGSGYSNGQDCISILLGNGDGTFRSYTLVPLPQYGVTSLAAADLNRDGKVDLVVATYGQSIGVSVLLGNGDGTFAPPVFYPVEPGASPTAVAIGDFNRDGKLDIAVTNATGISCVSVFLGKGDGTFNPAANYPASINSYGLVIGDFNGDGWQDIASLSYSIPGVLVLIGNGDGTFSNHVNYAVLPNPVNITTADFNGDGMPDLVIEGFNPRGDVQILLNKSGGGFTSRTAKVGSYPLSLATGDFNRDGKLDVVITYNDPKSGLKVLSTLLGNGDGTFQSPLNQTIGPLDVGQFAVADFDLDGNLDLVFASCVQNTTSVSVFFGKGDGTFLSPISFTAGGACGDLGNIVAADLNGDHIPDIVVSLPNSISVLLGNGNRSFQPYQSVVSDDSLLAVADFNGDGRPDLLVDNFSLSSVGVALGNGDGTFQPPLTQSLFPLSPEQSIIGDFNGDGKLDFAFVSGYVTLSIFLGNGDGTFRLHLDLLTEIGPWSLTAADFTGNGGLDIAAEVAIRPHKGVISVYPSRPVAAFYPSLLQFGSQKIGNRSPALNTTVYNSGGGPLAIHAITTKGDYSQTNTCGASLAVGSSCTVSVTFKPTKVGNRAGSLNIATSSTTRPATITLSGVGTK